MSKKAAKQRRIQILVVMLLVLRISAAAFWTDLKVEAHSLRNLETYTSEKEGISSISEEVLWRIKIPSIALDAAIENVGLTSAGNMDVPGDPLHAGWYALGPQPGEVGSAVIDGHVNWLYGATGVFANLNKVKLGDTITVQDEKGTSASFVVREIRLYDSKSEASDIFLSSDGKAHLNLITCDGVWDKSAQEYTERLVVFADAVITDSREGSANGGATEFSFDYLE